MGKTILVVGGTGRFGSKITEALLAKPEVQVRVLARKRPEGGDASGRISTFAGDLTDPRSLDAAVQGADAIISVVNGGPDVVVDGQRHLLEAARRHGVQRFIPSDYSLDFFALDYGDNVFLDYRKRVAELVDASGVPYTHVLNGGFMEVMLAPFMGTFDFQKAEANVWGTGDEPVDMITLDDAARYIAEIVLDPRAENRRVEVAGDVVSNRQIAGIYEELSGRRMKVSSRGTLEDLRRWIEERKATARSPLDYVFGQYTLAGLSGKGKLRHLANDGYPSVRPTRVRDFLASNILQRAA